MSDTLIRRLPNELQDQLHRIEPSEFRQGINVYPCAVTLRNGDYKSRVYLYEPSALRAFTGFDRPENLAHVDRYLLADEIESIRESPERLPARFANEIYKAGESGYGYFAFRLMFRFLGHKDYVGGGLIDFLFYPRLRRASHVVGVQVHSPKRRITPFPQSFWGVFSR